MQTVTIKFYRSYHEDIASYGADFNQRLDDFVSGAGQWDTRDSHGIAVIPSTTIQVQRYESGPEIIGLVIESLPQLLTAITGLILAWQKVRTREDELRTVKIVVGKHSYEGPVKNHEEVQKIIVLLSNLVA